MPFFRSVIDHAPLVRDALGCRAPSAVSETILLPVTATVGEPAGLTTQNPVFIEGTLHGKFVRSDGGVRLMGRLLSGAGVERHTAWRVIGWFGRAAGSAWEAPPLRLSAVEVWRRDLSRAGAPGAARLSCGQMQRLAYALTASATVRPDRH